MSARVRHRSLSRGRKEASDSEDLSPKAQPSQKQAPTTPAQKPTNTRSSINRASLLASPAAHYDPTQINQRIEEIKDAVSHDKVQLQELNERFARFLRRKAEQESNGISWKQRYDELFDQTANDMETARKESIKQLQAISQTNHDLIDKISSLTSQVDALQNERSTLASAQQSLQLQIGVHRSELAQINGQLAGLKAERADLLRKSISTSTHINVNYSDYANLTDGELIDALGAKDEELEGLEIVNDSQKREISRLTSTCSNLESTIRSYELEQATLLELLTGYEELLFQNNLLNTFSKYNLNNPDLKDDRTHSKITKSIASRRSTRGTIVPPTPVKSTPGKKKSTKSQSRSGIAEGDEMTDRTPQKGRKGKDGTRGGRKGKRAVGGDDSESEGSDDEIASKDTMGDDSDDGARNELDSLRQDIYFELRAKNDAEIQKLERQFQKDQNEQNRQHRDQVAQINTVVKQLQGQLVLQEAENQTLQQQVVVLQKQVQQLQHTVDQLEAREQELTDQLEQLELQLSILEGKFEMKCDELAEVYSLKAELQKQLVKYERLLVREEQRLGIYGLVNELPQECFDPSSALFDKLLLADDVPNMDSITAQNNQRLGIAPFYATQVEDEGREQALFTHQEFITQIRDQIDAELKSVDETLTVHQIQQNDFANYVNDMAASIQQKKAQPSPQYQPHRHVPEKQSSSWFGGLFGLFGSSSKDSAPTKPKIEDVTDEFNELERATKGNNKRKRGSRTQPIVEEPVDEVVHQDSPKPLRRTRQTQTQTQTTTTTTTTTTETAQKRASYVADDLFDVDQSKVVKNDDDDEFVSTDRLDQAMADEATPVAGPQTNKRSRRGKKDAIEEIVDDDFVQLDQTNPFSAISATDTDKASRLGPHTRKHSNNEPVDRTTIVTNSSMLVSGVDEFGQFIKIINGGENAINLEGWSLFTHGREFRFIFPPLAVIPSHGSFILRTLTNDDAENTFEPDDENCVTIFVKHALWSEEDDRCTLYSDKGKEKGSVRITNDNMFPHISQPGGCSIM